jgi:hypothetical protein
MLVHIVMDQSFMMRDKQGISIYALHLLIKNKFSFYTNPDEDNQANVEFSETKKDISFHYSNF